MIVSGVLSVPLLIIATVGITMANALFTAVRRRNLSKDGNRPALLICVNLIGLYFNRGGSAVKSQLQLTDVLRKVECFASLDDKTLTLLQQEMNRREYSAGDIICHEGDMADWMFVVGDGEVGVVKKAEDGTPVQVAVLEAGEVGGVMSLFEHAPRSATLQARDKVTLWILGHSTFKEILSNNGELAFALLTHMSQGLRRDSFNLAATLRYVDVTGRRSLYERCSPQERLILDTINNQVAAAASLNDMMEFLFTSMKEISASDRLMLALLEETGNRLNVHWVRADYEPLLVTKGYAEDIQGSSLQRVIEDGTPRVIDDLPAYLENNPRALPSVELMVQEGVKSSMACPLSVEGRTIGLLVRSSRETKAYDDHQVQLHLAIGERLAQAVDKVAKIEQLEAAQQAYFGMLGFVSHELKSPISTVVMGLELFKRGIGGELPPKQADRVPGLIGKCRYLLDLINEYLNLARLEGGEFQPAFQCGVDFINDVTNTSLELVSTQIDQKRINLEKDWPEGDITIECAPDLLQIVMTNLISNAIKYGKEDGKVKVTVAPTESHVSVSVWNEGPGFPDEQRSKLFRKFSRIQKPELMKQKGTGVGLYTTWRIIQAHGGRIQARSEEGKWAEFFFELPRIQEDSE